jgi:uncharacterized membrane protein SpoIIM required for sporulation
MRIRMNNVLPVMLFAFLVLMFPHGIFETAAMIGVLVTGGIGLYRVFR